MFLRTTRLFVFIVFHKADNVADVATAANRNKDNWNYSLNSKARPKDKLAGKNFSIVYRINCPFRERFTTD